MAAEASLGGGGRAPLSVVRLWTSGIPEQSALVLGPVHACSPHLHQ